MISSLEALLMITKLLYKSVLDNKNIFHQTFNLCWTPKKYFQAFIRVSDPDPDPQDPHVFALPGSGSEQKGKEMNE